MEIRNANLVIMFTDIVGFTSATAVQSRAENQELIDTHNFLLFPVIESFRGRHIKSIGDALLIVFESSTDALLCAMAMQDTLYAHNEYTQDQAKICIRIALHLGEVRVSKDDIMGDPVNVANRIEGITPPGEIYFSEAIYITMNRAEVATEAVAPHKLPGIREPVGIYRVPPVNTAPIPKEGQLADTGPLPGPPFGGKHLLVTRQSKTKGIKLGGRGKFFSDWREPIAVMNIVAMVLAAGVSAMALLKDQEAPSAQYAWTEPPVASYQSHLRSTDPVLRTRVERKPPRETSSRNNNTKTRWPLESKPERPRGNIGNDTVISHPYGGGKMISKSPPMRLKADLTLPEEPHEVVLRFGGTWKYLDDGSDQGTVWKELDFPVGNNWKTGKAEFGYGDGDEATILDCGPTAPVCRRKNHMTTYFRTQFHIRDASDVEKVIVDLLRDDAATIFINGKHGASSNLVFGAGFNDPASKKVLGSREEKITRIELDPTVLVSGSNLIAVEVHQVDSSSTDVSFDLRVTAVLK